MPPLFHLAFAVTDLEATRSFYVETLGCVVGRTDTRWIDFDFRGHQITAHLVESSAAAETPTNQVDGKRVPVRHFGLILPWPQWHQLAKRLRANGCEFLIEPHIRFVGGPGEQATLFLLDPSGNGLEFKSFRDSKSVFATD